MSYTEPSIEERATIQGARYQGMIQRAGEFALTHPSKLSGVHFLETRPAARSVD